MRNTLAIALFLVALALLIFFPAQARAEEEKIEGGFGVNLVYPQGELPKSYFLYNLAPGKKEDHEIDLVNNLPYALRVLVYPADCYNTTDGALAGPLFGETSSKVGTWVDLKDQEIILAPGKKKRVTFSVTVPADAKSGDHFGFVFLQPSPEKEEKGNDSGSKPGTAGFTVKVQQRLGICLVVRVPGDKTSGVAIQELEKSVDTKGQLYLAVDIANSGNVYLKPRIAWDLRDSGGESILYQDPTDIGYLLPGSPLRLQIPLITSRPIARGEYELAVSVEYESTKAEKTFTIQLP